MTRPAGQPARVALVHDWLVTLRGGEKVLAELCRLMPRAHVYTVFYAPGRCGRDIEKMPIHPSGLNALPGVRRYYRHLLPLLPAAAAGWDLRRYDLVVSSSHCVAKGAPVRPGQVHVCYCHTPMRYVWSAREDYGRGMGLSGLALRAAAPWLRAWDRRTAARVHLFLANSATVARRIRRVYGRASIVLYPPIDVDFFTPSPRGPEDFYLMVSAPAPYKRLDLAIEAFGRLGRPLKIIGAGSRHARVRGKRPSNVELLGWCSHEALRDHYRRCRAVIFPPLEDFGMVPLEAMACGRPVIAYGAGGARETVLDAACPNVPRPTGLLYQPQEPDALARAVERFEQISDRFDPAALRSWAEEFSPRRFAEGFRRAVTPLLARRGLTPPWGRPAAGADAGQSTGS